MWPPEVKSQALAACGRRCCICHEFCGTNIECHHIIPEADGGPSTFENCIPLCFDCHADAGHYNLRHPKGTKYTSAELRAHRDRWFDAMADLAKAEHLEFQHGIKLPAEIYEGQHLQFRGFLWREAFPGRPNYADLVSDEKETCWILAIPHAVTLNAINPESEASYSVTVKRIHLILNSEQYNLNRHLVLRDAVANGRIFPVSTGHHHGDALLEVQSLESAEQNIRIYDGGH